MKLIKLLLLCLVSAFAVSSASGQANASINILTLNSGTVNQGGVVDIQVSVGNTGPTSSIGVNKVRAQISVPTAICNTLPDAQQTGLPPGWIILSNAGGVITVCNGTDVIPVGVQRQILIKVQGVNIGGPSTVAGNLSFGPGTGVCTGLGSLSGDNTADNVSQSTIQVVGPACTLSGVSASAGTICNGGTTTLTATATGAAGTVEYSLNGGAFQSGNTFTVGAGTYTVTAREVSNPTCIVTATAVTVINPPVLLAGSSAPPITVIGGNTTVTVTASGGTPPYTGTGTFVRTAGTYTFIVTDANGCTANTTITLSDPIQGNANASINVLTLNSGIVNQGAIVDVQVTVGNTGPNTIFGNKVRAQISIPTAIASPLPNGQQTGLPSGWIILSNTGGVITVCNGTDVIPTGQQRQILIKVQGNTLGGPSTVSGVLSFGPGTGVCTGLGSLPGDITADNVSQSTIQVIQPLVNDDAPGAIIVTVGGGCSGSPYTNFDGTQSAGEPFASCKGTAGYKTVWYKFTAPATGNVKVSLDYTGGTMGTDSRLALFSTTDVNNYATFTNMACDDDNGAIVPNRSILYATGLISGVTYYVQVDGKDGTTATGTFCLTVDEMTSSMLSSATACATGQDLSLVNDNYTGRLSATDASGNLIALISNPSGGATTSTYIHSLNINSGPLRTDAVSGQKYLDRNFSINNASVSNVNMQFFLLNTELTALQAADPGLTLANLEVTRQTGATCDNDFVAANGTNSSLAQTGNASATGYSWVQVTSPGLSKFYLHRPAVRMPVKVWLQGAYTTTASLGGPRHRNNSAAWAGALNTGTASSGTPPSGNALSQPYNVAPFNYTGTESVPAGYFHATGNPGGVLDWVLLELRNGATPSTVVARRAAFVRLDGRIVDLDSSSDVLFRGVPAGTYHLVVRHRNHLSIRTSANTAMSATLGAAAPALANADFTTALAKAFDSTANLVNRAMKEITPGVWGMYGGNSNGMTTGLNAFNQVKASAPNPSNDYFFLFNTTLSGSLTNVLTNRYHPADVNMDGQVKMTAPNNTNDFFFLFNTTLSGNIGIIFYQHQ